MVNKLKVQNRKKISIFFSSTFLDMQGERDALITNVLPVLRERLYKLQIDLIDIDLRWGVLDYENEAQKIETNKWHYCKKAIDSGINYFVGILGQRYGSPQEEKDFQQEDFQDENSVLSLEGCIGKSLTEIEILHATNNFRKIDKGNDKRSIKSLFFFRSENQLIEDSVQEANVFPIDDEQESLKNLKNSIQGYGNQYIIPVKTYSCRWNSSLNIAVDLEQFSELLTNELWRLIFQDYIVPELNHYNIKFNHNRILETSSLFTDDYAKSLCNKLEKVTLKEKKFTNGEAIYIQSFISEKSQLFEGRARELVKLQNYITSKEARSPVLVYGESGLGKTSLLAHFQKTYSTKNPQIETICISRYIGINKSLVISKDLIKSITDELDNIVKVSSNYNQKEALFIAQIEEFSKEKKETRLIIIIDAVNQLEDVKAHTWIPTKLPENVKIIVSSTELLSNFSKDAIINLSHLKIEEKKNIIHGYLSDYGKALSSDQIKTLSGLSNAGNPLYLLVLLNELRTEHTVTDSSERLKELSSILEEEKFDSEVIQIQKLAEKYPTTASLFEWVLQKCERFFNHKIAEKWFSYLITSKSGASLQELNTMLQYEYDITKSKNGFRISRYVKPYLMNKEDMLFPYHSQFSDAIKKRYLDQIDQKEIIKLHYNWSKLMLNSWKEKNKHALKELPYHLNKSEQSDELYKLADNDEFLKLQVTVLGEIDLPQETQQEAMSRALKDKNALKTVEFLSKPLHMRAANITYTPLKALEEHHIEYALSIAESYAPQQTSYWYIILAWKLHTDDKQEKVEFVLKKLLEKTYITFTSATKNWILPNAIDYSREKVQNQNEWICKALVTMIDKHELAVLKIVKLFHDESLLLLFIKHLATEKHIGLSTSLLPKPPKNALNYLKTVLAILKNTTPFDNQSLNNIKKIITENTNYWMQSSYWIILANSLNELQKYDESLSALNPIVFDPIVITKENGEKPFIIDENLKKLDDQINIQLKTIIAYKSLLESLDDKNNLEESQWENIQQRLTYLYTNIPSELIRKSNEETNYTDDSIKGKIQEMLREFVNEGLALMELLYTLEQFHIAGIIENEIQPYVHPTVINYLKFKGKIAVLPNSISDDLLGGLIEEAFDFDIAHGTASALLLLTPFIENDELQKIFVNFSRKVDLILDTKKESKLNVRWFIFMAKQNAIQLANGNYFKEALAVVSSLLRRQWILEFEPISSEIDKGMCEYNGHGYALLRELSVIITNKKEWKILNEVAHYFDEPFRGKWILHNALMNTEQPKEAIHLAEEILILENWSLLNPKSTDSIQLNKSDHIFGYISQISYNKLTKKELKQKIFFLKWLSEITSGKKYTLRNILQKLLVNLKFQNGKFNGLISCLLFFVVLLPILLIINNIISEVDFFIYRLFFLILYVVLIIYLYIYLLKNSSMIAYEFFKNSSQTFTKIKTFNINVSDDFIINETSFFEFSRIKKPEKKIHPSVNFYNRFNYNFNHPQRVFIASFKKLLENILYKEEISINEVNILKYSFESIISHESETYNVYYQRLSDYKDPGYAPAIRTVSFGEYDELLLIFIEVLGKKLQYRKAFNWIKSIQDPNMEMKARLSLAYVQASNGDYESMKWTLENDIKKYNPSGKAYSSSLERLGNTMVSSFVPRILEELVFENKTDIAKKLIQLESNEEYKTNFEAIIKKAENEFVIYQQIENTKTSIYSDNWLFDKVPFIEIKYDQSIEGKINSLCLRFKNHLRKKEYDKIRLLVQKVENIEIRNILRISYLYKSDTFDEKEHSKLFNQIWEPFKDTYVYENTVIPALLYELFPEMNTWYLDTNDKKRWINLLILSFDFRFPNKSDYQINELIKSQGLDTFTIDDIYYAWTKHSILNGDVEKASQLFRAISLERSHQYTVAIFYELNEADVTVQQLFPFLKYCQSNPKLLYKAIQGLSAFFPEKVDELLVAIGVEGNRIDTYSRKKKEISFENKVESFKGYEEEMKVFLTAGETLIQHNEIDKAIYYYERVDKTIKFISFTEKTEELFERKSRLNVSILKAMYKYDLAYQEYNTLPIPNTDLNRAFHYSELAMILLLKYERQEAYLEDLKIVLKNACIAFKNIERELRFSKSTLHTDYVWTKIHIIFGRVAYQLGLNDRAGILLIYGSVIDKEKQPYLHLVADLLIEKKDYKGALYLTERDIENQSHYSDGVIKKLEIYMLLGDFEKVTEIALYYLKETDSVIDLMFLLMLCIAEDQMGIQTNPYAKQLGEKIALFSKKEFYYNYFNFHHLEEWINRNYHDGHQVKNLAIQVFSFFTSYKKEKTVKNSLVYLFAEADILIDYHKLRDKLIRADYPAYSFNFMV